MAETNQLPILAATAVGGTFTEGAGLAVQGTAVTLFHATELSPVEVDQRIDRLVLTVTGLRDGAKEILFHGQYAIPLGVAGTGTFSDGSIYTVTLAGDTATVTLERSDSFTAENIGDLRYDIADLDNPTPGERTISLVSVRDTGTGNNTTPVSGLIATVNVAALNDAPVPGAAPGPIGGDITVAAPAAGTFQVDSAIAALSDGGFVVSWWVFVAGAREIQAQRFNSDGSQNGAAFLVTTTAALRQEDPSVAALADGGFVITWHTFDGVDGIDIFGQRYAASGARVGDEFLINTTTADSQSTSAVTGLADGGFAVSWYALQPGSTSGDIYARRYGPDGVAPSNEFRVNTTVAGLQTGSSVAALANGGFVVVWQEDGTAIRGQRYAADGSAAGGEFRIDTATGTLKLGNTVTVLADGGFVVTWQSKQDGFADTDIYGQRFNSVGVALGGEFRINTTTDRAQISPAVAALGDGGFVVGWSSNGQDGSGYGIYGQRFDAAGQALGAEFRLNGVTAGSQLSSAADWLVQLTGGALAASWVDQNTATAFARLFDVNGLFSATVAEGATYMLRPADLPHADPDNDLDGVIFSISGLTRGMVTVDGAQVTRFSAAQLASGTVAFAHDGSDSAGAGFTFAIDDDDEDSSAPSPHKFTFTVTPVDDTPAPPSGGGGVSTGPTLVSGTAANDILTGTPGNDIFDGGAGIDTVVVGGSRADFALTRNPETSALSSLSGPMGTDTLISIERLRFSDGLLATDIVLGRTGLAAYRLYSVFDRAPDEPGLAYWIGALEKGMSLKTLADNFLGSKEFDALFGAPLSNAAYVARLYEVVLDRTAETGGLDRWIALLDSGRADRADVLLGFTESAENVSLVGQILAGGTIVL